MDQDRCFMNMMQGHRHCLYLAKSLSNCYNTTCSTFRGRVPTQSTFEKKFYRYSQVYPKRNCSNTPASEGKCMVQSVKDVEKGIDVTNSLRQFGISINEGYTCVSFTCPKFDDSKSTGKVSNKLHVNSVTGGFVCHTCNRIGTWSQLVENIKRRKSLSSKKRYTCFEDEDTQTVDTRDNEKIHAEFEAGIPFSNLSSDEKEDVIYRFDFNGLNYQVLSDFNIRVGEDRRSLIIPYYGYGGKLVGIKKLKNVIENGILVLKEETIPRLECSGLFGGHLIKRSSSAVVLTSSEADAMAVRQSSGLLAVSLFKGDTKLPYQVLPFLEQFNKITFWFDETLRGREATRMFSKKLNENRCFIVRTGENPWSPLVALRNKCNLKEMIKTAQPSTLKTITTFNSIKMDVYNELAYVKQVAGITWKRFPKLNSILKGHRRGELTVFTGPTGAGKTTFLCDYSLDLCLQGVNTLWGSFEIKNTRLMKMMLNQFAQKNISRHLNEFEHWANAFEQLPMYLMTFHGQENINVVIETMQHAVYMHDITHVIVDNLQFMMGTDSNSLVERFHQQDHMISAFRKFATSMNCHVSLVIHPRKENEDVLLTKASICGTAKASQEADNVLILQDPVVTFGKGSKKFIQVVKNRFDGDLGRMPLKYRPDCTSYAETKESNLEDTESTQNKETDKLVEDIIEQNHFKNF